jgi:dienelactone hydrolase
MAVGMVMFAAMPVGGRERYSEIVPGVQGELFVPDSGQPRAVIVLLHGFEGPRPIYRAEGLWLASHGYAALVVDYYADAAGGIWSGAQRARRWKSCQDAVVRAVAYVQTRADLPVDRIGLVGFSQGAAVELTTAPRLPEVSVIVDFFGPHPEHWFVRRFMGCALPERPTLWEQMPPLLILHGAHDPVVPVRQSRILVHELREHERDVELFVYPHELHGLNHARSGLSKSTVAADDAHGRVLDFLAAHFPAASDSSSPPR